MQGTCCAKCTQDLLQHERSAQAAPNRPLALQKRMLLRGCVACQRCVLESAIAAFCGQLRLHSGRRLLSGRSWLQTQDRLARLQRVTAAAAAHQ
jgi:hypothetical protein